jgi:hypothetical protein
MVEQEFINGYTKIELTNISSIEWLNKTRNDSHQFYRMVEIAQTGGSSRWKACAGDRDLPRVNSVGWSDPRLFVTLCEA